jgi:hypothetical protein
MTLSCITSHVDNPATTAGCSRILRYLDHLVAPPCSSHRLRQSSIALGLPLTPSPLLKTLSRLLDHQLKPEIVGDSPHPHLDLNLKVRRLRLRRGGHSLLPPRSSSSAGHLILPPTTTNRLAQTPRGVCGTL